MKSAVFCVMNWGVSECLKHHKLGIRRVPSVADISSGPVTSAVCRINHNIKRDNNKILEQLKYL